MKIGEKPGDLTTKQEAFDQEFARWNGLFEKATEETRTAAAGLIQRAAFLHSLCWELEQTIEASGAIVIHPSNPNLQKQVPAVREYARLSESYANIVNKLNRLLTAGEDEPNDPLSEFE